MRFSLSFCAALVSCALLPRAQGQTTQQPFPANYQTPAAVITTSAEGSTYVPMDSWMYPALDRLHSLGYLDTAFLGLRPWTRLSIAHMLQQSADKIDTSDDEQAKEIYLAVLNEVQPDLDDATEITHPSGQLESVYSDFRGIDGTVLRDSFHLGQTIIDDYGRPYQGGFNDYSGFSARAEAGRFSLYWREEYQRGAGATGYSTALSDYLSANIDYIPVASNPHQPTIPEGPIASADYARVMEATISYHLLGHEVSFGKSDHWMGPDQGASMLWSDNAQDNYAFQINRVEPLRIPLLSRLTGPFRYDFFVGSLKGHTYPNDPWVHVEKVSFKPTRNLEFGFSRMVIWGGKGHEPITLHTFLHSFFSFTAGGSEKTTRNDPGARFGTFDFSYRLPYLRNWLTLYTDSEVHDDVSPIDAPRRAAIHPGIYLARFPGLQRLDMRVEAASTDAGPVGSRDVLGQFFYYEGVQKQGPTNEGFLVTDWIGREDKGGQAWLTYHLSANEDVQFMYRNTKASIKFFPGGTTQNDFAGSVRKRIGKDIEVLGLVQYEGWKAPILTYPVFNNSLHNDTTVEARITWYPREKTQ
ncbi:MAG: capsule assembly Wzi family protein [Acidobacteriaceae bacterium]